MAQAPQTQDRSGSPAQSDDLRDSPMMARLLESLEQGADIGHYGRLTFAMVARYFMDDDDLVRLLANQPDHGEDDAQRLVAQVKGHGYNPPKRDRILQWQAEQEFQICTTPDDPSSCNVYSELKFPDEVYDNIGDFWEEKAESR